MGRERPAAIARGRRKALQRELLESEFRRRWGEGPCPPQILEIVDAMLALAA